MANPAEGAPAPEQHRSDEELKEITLTIGQSSESHTIRYKDGDDLVRQLEELRNER